MQLPLNARFRLGLAFAGSEIATYTEQSFSFGLRFHRFFEAHNQPLTKSRPVERAGRLNASTSTFLRAMLTARLCTRNIQVLKITTSDPVMLTHANSMSISRIRDYLKQNNVSN
jgi:hypothetical protein